MKLPSCVGETDQLLPGGPGSIKSHYDFLWDSLVAQKVKFTCNSRDPCLIHASGRFPGGGNGYLLQYSCLENFMDRGAWWATDHGITVRHD